MPSAHLRKRSESSWTVVLELGYDPVSKRRIRREIAVRGSEREAREKAAQLLAQATGGTLPAAGRTTLAQLLEEWLQHVQLHRERATVEDYSRWAERAKEALGAVRLDRLQPAHVQRWIDQLAQEPRRDGQPGTLSAESLRHAHRTLRAALGYAVRMGYLARNPAQQITLPERQRHEPTVLSESDLGRLLKDFEGSRWYALIYLVARTGLREGEALGLRWQDVDWDGRRIIVRQALKRPPKGGGRPTFGDVKNHERRPVDLADEDMAVLRRHRREQQEARLRATVWPHPELVFTTPQGDLIYPTVPSQVLVKVCRKAGLPPVSMHDLRHTHGSLLLRAGWDLATVSRRLGHSSPAFTAQVYVHEVSGSQRQYLDRPTAAQLPPMHLR